MNTEKSTGIAALLAALAMTGATAFGITIDTVTVGYAGNAADTATGYGAVSYEYQIGTTEVKNTQYVAFLNAVAATDTYSLYSTSMNGNFGGITRSGESGSYTYAVKAGWENKPVNFVSFYDAARFTNWLTNGQGGAGTTESGLYVFSDATTFSLLPDHATSTGWAIASEAEWYKAAYYNPTLNGGLGGYTNYPWAGGADPVADNNAVNGANFGQNIDALTDAGSYANATSYFRTYDQAGNISEWTDTIFSDSIRVDRGGAFESLATYISAASGRDGNAPATKSDIIGFRVAYLTAVPEPATYAALAGLAIMAFAALRRSRR
ncbi:PEP-CTERM putative exosortase interaction domain-containing protein [Opitutaceae bacterium TAV1]|nr:PEP-CTERM putative exosortase interaction domain-containing protein [Opitutaceae bacterium TAV1]